MSMEALRAAEFYAEAARLSANAPRSQEANAANNVNFGALVQDALAATQTTLKNGEAAASAAAAGQADLVDVVTAVSAAEVSLEAAIAVRNRVIEAYQEIMRMPI